MTEISQASIQDVADKSLEFSPYYCSSIGPVEYSVIPQGTYIDNDKVTKNLCTEVKVTSDQVEEVFRQVESYPLTEGARLNIRFITTLDVLAEVIKDGNRRDYIEGVTPLAGCGIPELEGMCIINLGRNHPQRPFDEDQFYSLLDGAQSIFATPVQKNGDTTKQHTVPSGYRYSPFDRTSDDAVKEKVTRLLVGFAWSKEEARAIINSPDVEFGLMIEESTGDVASLIGIESRDITLNIDGKTVVFKMQEVAEAKTAKGHEKRGLYGYANTEMMRQIVGNQDKIPHVLIGEINLHSPGHAVVRNAHKQGRMCGLMDPQIRKKLSLSGPSALRADFTIKGAGDSDSDDTLVDTQANSLLVTYQTQKMLISTYAPESP